MTRGLEARPDHPGRTTGIGSLPHRSVQAAIDASFRLDIPFLPHLPCLDPSEFMIPQALSGRALAADAFFERLASQPHPRVKFQIAGPLTLRAYAGESSRLPKRLEDAVAPLLGRAQRLGAPPLLFLDEPALATGSPTSETWSDLVELTSSLASQGISIGLHCCGETDWRRVLKLPIAFLSIDAFVSLPSVLVHARLLDTYFERGGRLALGILPTGPGRPDPRSPIELFRRIDAISPDLERFIRTESLLTPTCGLAGLSPDEADSLLETLQKTNGFNWP
jgi:hypothetical protein